MYGLVMEGVHYTIVHHFGEAIAEECRRKCNQHTMTFSTHERYSEKIVPDMIVAICEVTGESVETVGILAGRYFVHFLIHSGYGHLLQVMGRRFSDFLKGLDNLHEYFRFSYPHIRPPSFMCTRETGDGLILHYRSRRQGYISYVLGQLLEIGRMFFNLNVSIQVLRKEQRGSYQFVTMRVLFDNIDIDKDRRLRDKSSSLNEYMPVESVGFLRMFPFFVAFNKKLEIRLIGENLKLIMPSLVGQPLGEHFDLVRPAVTLTWDGLVAHLNCVFQMESLFPVQKHHKKAIIKLAVNNMVEEQVELGETNNDDTSAEDDMMPYLAMRGPMVRLRGSDIMLYLPTVMVESVECLHHVGLFLNDYGDSDCNKEIIMASVQKSDDLKEMLKMEKERSIELASTMRQVDHARIKALELLCTMMPRHVAVKLLAGGEPGVVCDVYEEVTIMFVKVCDFDVYTDKLDAVDIVTLLNLVYSAFDELIDRHGVYKVETIGESYMVSCGVPIVTPFHAEYIGDVALDMLQTAAKIDFAPIGGKKVQVKIGINSGPCVGAVVGKMAPRFCLFGDTVNCASRMESHNKMTMSIQVSPTSKDCMEAAASGKFKMKHRGMVNLKGKGEVKAFGLTGKAGRARYITDPLTPIRMEDEGEEDDRPVYTSMEDDGAESTLSRMSMGSGMGTGSRASEMASRASGASSQALYRDQGAMATNMTAEEAQLLASWTIDSSKISPLPCTTDNRALLIPTGDGAAAADSMRRVVRKVASIVSVTGAMKLAMKTDDEVDVEADGMQTPTADDGDKTPTPPRTSVAQTIKRAPSPAMPELELSPTPPSCDSPITVDHIDQGGQMVFEDDPPVDNHVLDEGGPPQAPLEDVGNNHDTPPPQAGNDNAIPTPPTTNGKPTSLPTEPLSPQTGSKVAAMNSPLHLEVGSPVALTAFGNKYGERQPYAGRKEETVIREEANEIVKQQKVIMEQPSLGGSTPLPPIGHMEEGQMNGQVGGGDQVKMNGHAPMPPPNPVCRCNATNYDAMEKTKACTIM